MNVIISNKYRTLLADLNIDVIKRLDGEYTADEIIANFTNFYFNKMILDITAIKGYLDIQNIQALSVNFDMNKVIVLLDDSEECNSPKYLSQLVSMGIYNFTRSVDAIAFLMNNPNTYKDVAQYHQLNPLQNASPSKKTSAPSPSTFESSSNISSSAPSSGDGFSFQKIIGIKNCTNHAGSTTLTYLLKKHLEKKYRVVAVEVDTNDFEYLNDRTLQNVSSMELTTFLAKQQNADVVIVDLGDRGDTSLCNEVLYLIEPGLIKLNKLIRQDRRIFEKLKGKKIILNRSVLTGKDVDDFEYESRSNIFFNIPSLDDKLDYHPVIMELLVKLGFSKFSNDSGDSGGKIFNIFK